MTLAAVTRVLVLAAMALGAVAGGARADDASEGRRLFQKGEEYLRQGDYRAAADAFEAGYRMAPRAGFLLNIGNCYRKLGELGKARQYYWRFLDAAPKDHPSRAGVIEYLRAMEQIEADGVPVDPASAPPGNAGAPASEPAPPPTSAPSAPEIVPLEPVEQAPAPVAVQHAAPAEAVVGTLPPAPADRTPVWRRWWFWTAAGAVVAGAVVVVAVIARPPAPTCAASLGCARE